MLGLRGFLFARLDRHVMADCASRNRTENGVMMRIVAGNGAHDRPFDAARVSR
jgi:hypothetical protein